MGIDDEDIGSMGFEELEQKYFKEFGIRPQMNSHLAKSKRQKVRIGAVKYCLNHNNNEDLPASTVAISNKLDVSITYFNMALSHFGSKLSPTRIGILKVDEVKKKAYIPKEKTDNAPVYLRIMSRFVELA